MYADYAFYSETYLGNVIPDNESFKRPEQDASERLDYFTFGRIAEADDRIRLAVCKMADILYLDAKRKVEHGGREVSSENNDGYSVSYAGINDQERKKLVEKELYDAAYVCLSRTGLMDWGAY